MVAGCSSNAGQVGDDQYPGEYQRLSENFGKADADAGKPAHDDSAARAELIAFIELFENIKRDYVADRVREIYADAIYFNDTLKTIYDNNALADYLDETAKRIDYNRVDIHQVLFDGSNYYLRWSMETGFSLFGRSVRTESIGMTQLRLDESGKVTFHQDFWDNTEGLFRHIPVLGFMLDRTKSRF